MNQLKLSALRIASAGIEAVKPERLFTDKMRLKGNILTIKEHPVDLSRIRNIYIIGAGKASGQMARQMELLLGKRITGGVVSTKYGHSADCSIVRIMEAGHPVIDENSLQATGEILRLAEDAGKDDLVFCLLSGGGSALMESLPEGINLPNLQVVFELLLSCGAAIEEINAVRKHLSRVKGGQLARAVFPAACISLVLSDVIGDPMDAIASGPTAPDSTTFSRAWQVIEKYRLRDRLPKPVREHLQNGQRGQEPETLKNGDPVFKRVQNIILGNNREALQAARAEAEKLGFNSLILTSRVQGEAREVARVVSAIVQEEIAVNLPVERPACILMGGETTVSLKGGGKGGRNQELALAALLAMGNEESPYLIASVGTDGTDGPTDAAGGMVYSGMLPSSRELGLDPRRHLSDNDAYPFLEKAGGLIRTGPTGTNVMDIVLALIP